MKTSSLAATLLAASPALAAQTYVVDPSHSEVSFQVRHLMVKARGRFGAFGGTIRIDPSRPEASSVEFAVQATSIDTANAERDAHLRSADFFDVERHPTVRFTSSSIRVVGQDRYEVAGVLSLRGVQKPIVLPVTFLGFLKDPWGNEKAGFETSVTLNRREFGMVWNKALDAGGVILGDEVQVSITLEAARQKEAAGE